MENGDKKRHIDSFYKAYRKNEDISTFSGLQRDIINSLGSERKELWSSPYAVHQSLEKSR